VGTLTKRFSKILITGSAGFIGSHIVDRMLDEGSEVTVSARACHAEVSATTKKLNWLAPYVTAFPFRFSNRKRKNDIMQF
jgi:UDP-glucose 4-epimerase